MAKLYFYYSAMNAGKKDQAVSTLEQAAQAHEERYRTVQAV